MCVFVSTFAHYLQEADFCKILHHLILKGLENIIENFVSMVMHMMNSIKQ